MIPKRRDRVIKRLLDERVNKLDRDELKRFLVEAKKLLCRNDKKTSRYTC
jgi:hypothetical protein